MVKVKPLDKAKAKYVGIADEAQRRYSESIDAIVWQGPAIAGQSLYDEKMADPNIRARRKKKLERVTDEEFKGALRAKGATRIAAGMRAGVDKWEKNWSPYKAALEEISLPAKVADPMANIDARLKPIVAKMVAKKNELG